MKTYGTVAMPARSKAFPPVLELAAEPHVIVLVKRLWTRVQQHVPGVVVLTATDEACRDLVWLCSRWPLKFTGRFQGVPLHQWVQDRADAYDQRGAQMLRILEGEHDFAEVAMGVTPRPYQLEAAALAQMSGSLLLADVVGLGKTISALTLLSKAERRPALIVAQSYLAGRGGQWEREVRRCLPGVHVHSLGLGRPYDLPRLAGMEPEILICSYGRVAGWVDHLAGRLATLVLDEAQEVRRTGTGKHDALRMLARTARCRIGLTATPVFNYGDEMHSVLDVVAPDVLPSRGEFIREWCVAAGSGHQAIRDLDAFNAWMRTTGVYLRRTREDVGRQLPAVTEDVIEISGAGHALRDAKADAVRLALRVLQATSSQEAMQAGGELSFRLRQATGIDKAPAVAGFVRLLIEQGTPVVLYGWHREVYGIWREALADLKPAFITGSESQAAKRESQRAFVEGDTDLVVISLRAGQGIDGLQARGSTVVFGELDWSPGIHEQCVGRLQREGQTRPVFAYFVVSQSGSDPVVADVLGLKQAQVDGVLGVTDLERAMGKRRDDGGRVQSLARAYLEQNRVSVPAMSAKGAARA